MKQTQEIPVHRSPKRNRIIGKTMQLLHAYFFSVKAPCHHPAAGSAQIDGQQLFFCFFHFSGVSFLPISKPPVSRNIPSVRQTSFRKHIRFGKRAAHTAFHHIPALFSFPSSFCPQLSFARQPRFIYTEVRTRHMLCNPVLLYPCRMHSMRTDGKSFLPERCACSPESGAWSTW